MKTTSSLLNYLSDKESVVREQDRYALFHCQKKQDSICVCDLRNNIRMTLRCFTVFNRVSNANVLLSKS